MIVQPLNRVRANERLTRQRGMLRQKADASLGVFHGLQNFHVRRVAFYLGQLHARTVCEQMYICTCVYNIYNYTEFRRLIFRYEIRKKKSSGRIIRLNY